MTAAGGAPSARPAEAAVPARTTACGAGTRQAARAVAAPAGTAAVITPAAMPATVIAVANRTRRVITRPG